MRFWRLVVVVMGLVLVPGVMLAGNAEELERAVAASGARDAKSSGGSRRWWIEEKELSPCPAITA
jgi:hypothetical protein